MLKFYFSFIFNMVWLYLLWYRTTVPSALVPMEELLAPFTHTDFTGKIPVNCRKEIMCEHGLFKNTGKFDPAIYQYEKL